MPATFWPSFWEQVRTPNRPDPGQEIRAQLRAPDRTELTAATVRLVGDDGSHCSASVISPEGHLLTALHCVERCLMQHDLLERFKSPYIETLSFRTKAQPAAGAVCKGFRLPESRRMRVELVHLGPGVVNFVDYHPISRIPEAEFERLIRLRGDFAILKAAPDQPNASAKPLPCAQAEITPLPENAGSALYALGFPLAKRSTKLSAGTRVASRGPAARGADLAQLIEGHIAQSLSGNPVIRDSGFSEGVFRRVEAFHQGPGVRLAHLDIYPGMSGGPVVNHLGRVVGAVSGVVDETRIDAEFVPNNGVYTPLSFIYAELQKAQGPVLAARAFSCNNKH